MFLLVWNKDAGLNRVCLLIEKVEMLEMVEISEGEDPVEEEE